MTQWKTQGDSCHHVVTTLGLSVMTDMYPWQATVIPVPNLCMLGVYSALQEVRQQKRHGHGTKLAIEMSQNRLGRSPTLCTSCNAPEDQTKPIQGLDAGMQAQAVCWRQGVRRAAPKRVGAALQGTNRASSTSLRRCIRHFADSTFPSTHSLTCTRISSSIACGRAYSRTLSHLSHLT